MQANVEVLEGLSRKILVTTPADTVDQKIDEKMKELLRTATLPGFRAGKVPPQLIRQKFGKSVRAEVIHDLIQSTYQEALVAQNLSPAGTSKIEVTQDIAGLPFEYHAIFEVYPDIHFQNLSSTEIERLKVDITEKDVDFMLHRLQVQKATWKEADRAVQKGDRITMNIEGLHNGKCFTEDPLKETVLELGLGNNLPGFEEAFMGHKAGDAFDIPLTLPADYYMPKLAGEPVVFQVTLRKVEAPELPELNEDFVKNLGVETGNVDDLRKQVLEQVQEQIQASIEQHSKSQLLEKLVELHPIDVPNVLIQQELQALKEQRKKRFSANATTEAEEKELLALAQRRVRLSLLFSKWIDQNALTPDLQAMQKSLEKIINSYPPHMHSMIAEVYQKNEQTRVQLEQQSLEDQVVKQLLDQTKMIEKKLSYREFQGFHIEKDEDFT